MLQRASLRWRDKSNKRKYKQVLLTSQLTYMRR